MAGGGGAGLKAAFWEFAYWLRSLVPAPVPGLLSDVQGGPRVARNVVQVCTPDWDPLVLIAAPPGVAENEKLLVPSPALTG